MSTAPKAMAADYTVIAAGHPESAASEVIADAGFCVEPTVDAVTERLDAALDGARPPTSSAAHARQYDWDAIAEQAETVYRRAIDGAR
ncbi:hypothetical protein [Halorubrum sp. GN11GM_10-3_MGM]|uniref:hypothetical protein n=1 Tax=Halorubrum sp. GN11GM_10-3_MGM TaxID=2518111 RepID=UPI0018EE98B3|nr:hypothetical protein [Halorubrum sp. GN11GM_10-3_MGM]